MSTEKCACPVTVAGYRTHCMLSMEHIGQCLPKRSDLTRELERLNAAAEHLSREIIRMDEFAKREPWPYEGPRRSKVT